MAELPYGALPGEWDHFANKLGLITDLLPVVSNPGAKISPNSKMAAIGKTPSIYNGKGQVAGIPGWTQSKAYPRDITRWDEEPDYGICIQTRSVRAIDVDVTDEDEAARIRQDIFRLVGNHIPGRMRGNAHKFLLAFTLPGEYTKRIIRTQHGIIEFLANGQQFVACGTHPSGSRYEWVSYTHDDMGERKRPEVFPELTPEQFEAVWADLEAKFAIEASATSKATQSKEVKLQEAIHLDETAQKLIADGLVLSTERDGRLHIVCPFEEEHTGSSAESSTSYFPANTGGYALGHFKCLHAHCDGRTDDEFREAIGMSAIADDFADLTQEVPEGEKPAEGGLRFSPQPAARFAAESAVTEWIIKGMLPKAELAMVYGPPGSGKTFWVLDLVSHVVRGLPWNGRRVKQGRCLYIAAEGANGVRKRVQAYQEYNGLDLATGLSDLFFIADTPRLTEKQDRKDLAQAIRSLPPVDVVVIDTLAATSSGADENSSKEMGEIINYCKGIHKHFGALVLLVHHSGKDVTKGARGSSVILGALDCEIQISRVENDRVATITKLKDGDDAGQAYGFTLNTVELGQDADGDPITSCVVMHSTGTGRTMGLVKDPIERVLLNTLEDLVLLVDRVTVNDLIEQTIDKLPFDDGNDRRRVIVMKAIERAVADERIRIHEGYVE